MLVTYKGSMVRQLSTDYDLLGNITRKVTGLGEGKNVTAYQYDVSAGVAGQGGINAVNEVDIDGTHYTLTYNANGGITYYDAATGSDKWVQWSGRGKPTRISKGPSEAAFTARDDFAYGVDGMRYYHKTQWYKAGNLKTQHTFYVGGFEDVLTDADSTYSRLEKAYLGNQIQVRATRLDLGVDNFAEYLVTDHLGSVEAVIDEAGVVLNLAYDPFGERRDANWLGQLDETELTALADELGIKTSRGYTGHEHLDRTGLIHMNGRVYDPVLGRFLSADPLVQAPYFSQSYNRYSYVWNNPVAMVDPSGYAGTGSQAGGTDTGKNKDTAKDASGDRTIEIDGTTYVVSEELHNEIVSGTESGGSVTLTTDEGKKMTVGVSESQGEIDVGAVSGSGTGSSGTGVQSDVSTPAAQQGEQRANLKKIADAMGVQDYMAKFMEDNPGEPIPVSSNDLRTLLAADVVVVKEMDRFMSTIDFWMNADSTFHTKIEGATIHLTNDFYGMKSGLYRAGSINYTYHGLMSAHGWNTARSDMHGRNLLWNTVQGDIGQIPMANKWSDVGYNFYMDNN